MDLNSLKTILNTAVALDIKNYDGDYAEHAHAFKELCPHLCEVVVAVMTKEDDSARLN
jgi:hypothetical protein